MLIEIRRATRWIKCCSCQSQIRTDEKFLQVVKANGKDERGERYCPSCEKYARLNNDIDEFKDEERGLRERETYAAYQAAGATSAYWDDRDSGFA